MSRQLPRPYLFATSSPNYPAGSQPWSGTPRIVVPSLVALADGFTPNTPIAAETQNYLEQIKADAISVVAHSALQRWQRLPVGGLSGSFGNFLAAARPNNALALVTPNILYGVGVNTNNTFGYSLDGSDFGTIASAGGSLFTSMAVDRANGSNVFCSMTATPTLEYTLDGISWATATPGYASDYLKVYYAPGGHYLAATLIGVSSATSLTGSWANNVHGFGNCTPVQFADNGSAVVLLMNRLSDGHALAACSADDGRTYAATPFDFGVCTASMVYSPTLGAFVILTSLGQTYTSPDGVHWFLQNTASSLTGIITPGYNKFAAAGNALVHLVERSAGSKPVYLRGVAYSFDLGASWYLTNFGSAQNGTALKQLINFNGALIASDDTCIYRSGFLIAPDASF